jgi:hypothetical protein
MVAKYTGRHHPRLPKTAFYSGLYQWLVFLQLTGFPCCDALAFMVMIKAYRISDDFDPKGKA